MTFLRGSGQEYAYSLTRDTIAYLVIILPKDTETLQEDLEDLATWENKWHMEFHANKCVVLTVSGKRAPIHADYKLHDQTLTRVKSSKYLGVTLTDDQNGTSILTRSAIRQTGQSDS